MVCYSNTFLNYFGSFATDWPGTGTHGKYLMYMSKLIDLEDKWHLIQDPLNKSYYDDLFITMLSLGMCPLAKIIYNFMNHHVTYCQVFLNTSILGHGEVIWFFVLKIISLLRDVYFELFHRKERLNCDMK